MSVQNSGFYCCLLALLPGDGLTKWRHLVDLRCVSNVSNVFMLQTCGLKSFQWKGNRSLVLDARCCVGQPYLYSSLKIVFSGSHKQKEVLKHSIYTLCVCLGVVEPVEVADNGDQTHTVNYVPTREGPYSINVLYADEEIPRR